MRFLELQNCLGLGEVERNFNYTSFTTTTSAVFLPTVWSREVVRSTENALVAAGLVKRYDYLVQGRGQTIDIPNISNAFTARSKSQGTDVTDDNATETQTQITINNWYYNSFIIEDIVSVQSIYKNIVALGSNPYRTFRKFGGHPCDMDNTEPSLNKEGVETKDGTPYMGDDIVRTYV